MTARAARLTAGARPVVRLRSDLVLAAAGALVLVVSALPVEERSVSSAERAVFDGVNGDPGLPFGPVWLLMQAGNVAAVVAATVGALLARRPRLAGGLVLAGVSAYAGAKLVKQLVTRGRPATLVEDVVLHGEVARGLGFVSGHAAVVVALAVVAFPYLGPRARWAAAGCAAVVCLARVYVGAHLPLDVVGGAALGILAGAALRFGFGRPAPCS